MRNKLLLIVSWLLVFSCEPEGSRKKEVVAWVNDQPIYLADYQEEMGKNWVTQETSTDELDFLVKLKCLEQMIEQKLILEEANRLGIRISQEELNSELKKLVDLDNPELEKKFAEKGTSKEKWAEEMRRAFLVQKTLELAFRYQVFVSEQELKSYYEKHQKSLREPEQVRVSQILVSEEKQARDLLQQIKEGVDFKMLAQKYSKGVEAKKGGDLGWVERGELPQFLEEKIFALPPQMVSGPISSPFGYHILMVEERKPEHQLSFEEAKGQIQKMLEEEKKKVLYKNWIKSLYQANRIRINYQLL